MLVNVDLVLCRARYGIRIKVEKASTDANGHLRSRSQSPKESALYTANRTAVPKTLCLRNLRRPGEFEEANPAIRILIVRATLSPFLLGRQQNHGYQTVAACSQLQTFFIS
jgi:hypothetical protein